MDVEDFLLWFLVWFVLPVLAYCSALGALMAAYSYGGWLTVVLLYGFVCSAMLWAFDRLGRAISVDHSKESLFERYGKELQYVWPGSKGDAARLQFARENLARAVKYLPDQADLPIYMGRYGEIEIYPRAVIASENFDEYIRHYFGPKWHVWAMLGGFLVWPISMPLAFVAMHVYTFYREWKEGW